MTINSEHINPITLNEKRINKGNINQLLFESDDRTIEGKSLNFIKTWLDDTLVMSFETSGSTGQPKTISYPKQMMEASAQSTGDFFDLKAGQLALVCLPIKYIAGKMMIVRSHVLSLNLFTQEPSSHPKIDRHYDFVAMTPMQVTSIIKKDPQSLELIRHLIIGGGQINRDLNIALNKLKKVQCYETYGMTETITHIAIRKINGPEKQFSFHALKGVSFNKDEMNKLMISASHLNIKLLQTNDIIDLINSKEFIWKGRADYVINSGGFKIQPEVIEREIDRLIDLPFFIAGIKDEILGERMDLFIEEKNIVHDVDKTNLDLNISKVLAKNKRPKNVIFLDHFLYTNSGKMRRRATLKLHGYE